MPTYSVSLCLSVEADTEEEAIEGFTEKLSENDFDGDSISVEVEGS